MIGLAALAFQATVWKTSKDGDLALVPFQSAPFPHSSRDNGFQSGATFYARDPHYSDSTVGVFVPKNFKPTKSVNFVVHFHGWNNHVEQVFEQYDLARQMEMTGLNAVLLVPQGPRDAPDSTDGKLQYDKGSLTALLSEAIGFLVKEGRVPPKSTLGHVALTAHSGGYLVTTYIVDRKELADKITDVILFDATYGGLPAFADYCAADKNHRLISICTEHLGHENARLIALLLKRHVQPRVLFEEDLTDEEVAKRGPLIVLTTTLEHNDVISKRDYFAKWLRTCRFR
ncbi:MAG: hypothetical protein P4L46_00230 [Fimbriimonas sp.]|nr:hypothetical protein [Fimbriimonas sp.]